jgi:hypothetical protein
MANEMKKPALPGVRIPAAPESRPHHQTNSAPMSAHRPASRIARPEIKTESKTAEETPAKKTTA